MAAGPLRDRVTFQVEAAISDGGGGSALSWSDALTVWGGFSPGRAREQLEAGRLEGPVAGVLKVRSSTETRTITTAHRAMIDGEAYQIRSITNPDRQNRFLEILVERGVAT